MFLQDLLPKIPENGDAFIERRKIKTITATNGKIDDRKEVEKLALRVRVLENGVKTYITTDPEKFSKAFEEVQKAPAADGEILFPERGGEYFVNAEIDVHEKEIVELSSQNSLRVTVSFYFEERETLYSNGEISVHQVVPRAQLRASLTYKGKNVSTLRVSKGGLSDPFDGFVEEFEQKKEEVKKLDSAKNVDSGVQYAILDPEMVDLLVHEAVGHSLEADEVFMENSLLERGLRIGTGEINIVDDPMVKEFGHFKYDDEGFEGNAKKIVEKGIVKTFLSDSFYADKTGVEPGNARCDFGYPPIPRMSNTFLEPGDLDFSELLEELKDGYLVKGFAGGTVSPKTGVFQFGSEYGYRIENGEIRSIVRGTSVSGNLKEVFKTVRGLSKDVLFHPGWCGKDGQKVPVSGGGPYALVKVMLGG